MLIIIIVLLLVIGALLYLGDFSKKGESTNTTTTKETLNEEKTKSEEKTENKTKQISTNKEIKDEIDVDKLEKALKKALIENVGKEEGISYREFTWGEGHKLLKSEVKEGKIYAYVVAEIGTYALENGEIKTKSAMSAPIAIIFNIDASDNYVFEKYLMPEDGMNWSNSLKEIFPSDIVDQALNEQCATDFYQNQIKSYLNK